MNPFVIDASSTLPWCFRDETTHASVALLNRLRAGDQAIAPAHWPVEVMNGLIIAVRRNRIPFNEALEFCELLSDLPISIEPPSAPADWNLPLVTAVESRLTAYDAAYLHLAAQNKIPLATFDRELQRAAQTMSVELIDLS